MSRVEGAFSKCAGSAVALALVIGLAACGGPPNWVKKGSGAFNEKTDKSFYGVGSVVGVRNEPLAWDTAENRSRAKIATTIEIYTAAPTNLEWNGLPVSGDAGLELGLIEAFALPWNQRGVRP